MGGGLYSYSASGSLTLTGCTVTANSVGKSGGGLSSVSSSVTLTDCTVSGNSAGLSGGGLSNADGTLMMTDTNVNGNYAGSVDNNGLGGGVYSDTGTNTLTDCTISGNTVSNGGGGGLCVSDSTTTLVYCSVSNNLVSGSEGSGGGIQTTSGTAALTGCTINGNSVGFNGGGVANSGRPVADKLHHQRNSSVDRRRSRQHELQRHNDHTDCLHRFRKLRAIRRGGLTTRVPARPHSLTPSWPGIRPAPADQMRSGPLSPRGTT